MSEPQQPYVLGIDLGTNSVGWAVLGLDEGGAPCRVLDMGVRVFQAGVEGDIASGRDESRNVKRRQARLMRRQIWRRTRRMDKVFHVLQRMGLLPPGNDRHALLQELDRTLRRRLRQRDPQRDLVERALPYLLRARALDEKLAPDELGLALYHLAHRRGFKSNRKTALRDKETGVVKESIATLRQDMEAAGCRTLGEHFLRCLERGERVRGRWTARDMYEEEFDRIWDAQAQWSSDVLTPEWRAELHEAIFHQRPLRSQKDTVGRCELEPDEPRAPRASLVAQRFRYWQWINNLEVHPPTGSACRLTPEQREVAAKVAETSKQVNLASLRKKLGFDEESVFQYEIRGDKKLPGNTTAHALRRALGKKSWEALGEARQEALVTLLLEDELDDDEVLRRLEQEFGLTGEAAESVLAAVGRFEQGYVALSEKAMRALLPRLEEGERYATARQAVYGDRHAAGPGKALLPPALEVFPSLRNPVVLRSLTQLRKVVNALIRRYGTPERVHVELARDMKQSREQRTRIAASQRERRKRREEVAEKIRNELGFDRVRSADIEKVLLAEECRWHCPYMGRSISMKALLGKSPQFDIEHIVPFSRCLDNSFVNKTLCYHEENRNRKRNKTPYEAYGKDEQHWNEILQRVRRFAGDRRTVHEKLRRFQLKGKDLEKFVEDFQAHQLQDTRYASRLAADYLGVLFGGRVDTGGRLRVQVRSGQLTALLRGALGLNGLLNDRNSNIKSRDDHRHHAVDALVIALTDQGMVQRLARAADVAPSARRGLFADLDEPWANFRTEVAERVAAIVVSHAVRRKVSGPLHKETLYSRPIKRRLKGGKTEVVRRVRRELATLKKSELERIADPVVRRRVKDRVEELGGGDPSRLFADPKNLPWLAAKDGRRIPIRKVRIEVGDNPVEVARGRRKRHVVPGNNHHMEVWEETRGGKTVWRWEVVTMLEAYRRVRAGEPVVRRDRGSGTRFLFSLAPGEVLELEEENGRERFVVMNFSAKEIGIRRLSDARSSTVLRQLKQRKFVKSAGRLERAKARKIVVSPDGQVAYSHE